MIVAGLVERPRGDDFERDGPRAHDLLSVPLIRAQDHNGTFGAVALSARTKIIIARKRAFGTYPGSHYLLTEHQFEY